MKNTYFYSVALAAALVTTATFAARAERVAIQDLSLVSESVANVSLARTAPHNTGSGKGQGNGKGKGIGNGKGKGKGRVVIGRYEMSSEELPSPKVDM